MIAGFIFFLHFLFILIIFSKKWQNESISSAFTNSILIIILFAIGWSLATFLTKLIIDTKGFGVYFDRDSISLVILTFGEYFFYKMYFGKDFIEDGTEK
ncbi:MAG TPA: hypothetical protein PL041_13975 [Melioribacteraceae bacterium]|nr:hypothetical protein [Melioribacteraceae bacterium]